MANRASKPDPIVNSHTGPELLTRISSVSLKEVRLGGSPRPQVDISTEYEMPLRMWLSAEKVQAHRQFQQVQVALMNQV